MASLMDSLGSMGGGGTSLKGGDAGPTTSSSSTGFDSSGWAVSFGAGKSAATGSNDPSAPLDMETLLPLALAALVVLVIMRKRKKG